MNRRPALALHGGAGTILRQAMTEKKEAKYYKALKEALEVGWACLESGGSALDAVEKTVVFLEDCPLFNAGRGSVFTRDQRHEMDAAIMWGPSEEAGAVAGVVGVRNPISLARSIMEKSKHVLLCGEGARCFALEQKLSCESEDYFYSEERHEQLLAAQKECRVTLDHSKFGTVGAVAVDTEGHVAAATSTGGMTNKHPGRVGDTCVIGAGTYASDKTCAVSCTGHGEHFIRAVAAYDVACRMAYGGLSLQEAAAQVIFDKLAPRQGEGGLIAVDPQGELTLPFNCEGMYRAWQQKDQPPRIEIYR